MTIQYNCCLLYTSPAAQGASAVDNRHADVAFRRFALFKTVHRLPAGQAGDAVNDRRAGAGGDIDDLFAFDGVELKRAAQPPVPFSDRKSVV